MNADSLSNSFNFPIGTSMPKEVNIHHFNELSWSEKQKDIALTCEQTREDFTRSLEESLKKWINITNRTEYNALKKILEKYKITPILWDTIFDSINWGVWITIKKIGMLFKIYNNPSSQWSLLPEIGTIEKWNFTKTNQVIHYFWADRDRGEGNSPVPKDIWECAVEAIKEESKNSSPKLEKISETHIGYQIKKWDSLWKIIKKMYQLSDSPEDRRCVWNIIEEIKKDSSNRSIIKNEKWKIFVWDILSLPQVVSVKFWREKKEFKLAGKN